MFGKIDQMSRKEVETRLAQLMGNMVEIGVETKKEDIKVVEEVEEEELSSTPVDEVGVDNTKDNSK